MVDKEFVQKIEDIKARESDITKGTIELLAKAIERGVQLKKINAKKQCEIELLGDI